MRLPLAPSPQNKQKFLNLVYFPSVQFQGLGGRVLVIPYYAVLDPIGMQLAA